MNFDCPPYSPVLSSSLDRSIPSILPSCLPVQIDIYSLTAQARMSIVINVWNLVNQTGLTILLSGHQVHFFFFKTNIFQNFIMPMIPYESLIMNSFHTFNTDFFSQYTFPFPKHYKVQAIPSSQLTPSPQPPPTTPPYLEGN